MATPDIEGGKRAAYAIYRRLRHEGISYTVAFSAALEKFQQFCPDVPPAQIEAAAWEAIQKEVSGELTTEWRSQHR